MSQKGNTPDEKFLIKLYQAAMSKGDPLSEVEILPIMRSLGQRETAIKNIIKHLAQANFVKKVDDMTLVLTRHGCDFVLEELEG